MENETTPVEETAAPAEQAEVAAPAEENTAENSGEALETPANEPAPAEEPAA